MGVLVYIPYYGVMQDLYHQPFGVVRASSAECLAV